MPQQKRQVILLLIILLLLLSIAAYFIFLRKNASAVIFKTKPLNSTITKKDSAAIIINYAKPDSIETKHKPVVHKRKYNTKVDQKLTQQNNTTTQVPKATTKDRLLREGQLKSLYESAQALATRYGLNRSVIIINHSYSGSLSLGLQIADYFKKNGFTIIETKNEIDAVNTIVNEGIKTDRYGKTDVLIDIGVVFK